MSRRAVNVLLVSHILLVWGAFVFRVDLFPLTWAPMYSWREGGTLSVPLWDRSREFRAVRRDGQEEWITREDLNIPTLSYWRLYYERAFEGEPNVFQHGNRPMEPWCYWVRDLAPGEPRYRADWKRRVLTSVNATLGREWDDPSFIVTLEARAVVTHFEERQPERWSTTEEVATLVWDEHWNAGGSAHDEVH